MTHPMESQEPWLRWALWLAATAVLPSLVYLAVRRPIVRRRGPRIAAWVCLWAGQLLVPLVLVAWLSLALGGEMQRLGSLLAAIVFGGCGAMVAVVLTVAAARLLHIGMSILRGREDTAVVRHCGRVVDGSFVGLTGVLALFGLMMVLPIPGRFGGLVYLVLIVIPSGIAAALLLLVAIATPTLLRQR
jgi:hypothetical protein